MFGTSVLRFSQVSARRLVHTATKEAVKASATKGIKDTKEVAKPQASIRMPILPKGYFKQAPNRDATWSPSQVSREDVYHNNVRFVGVDLSKQPQPEAAIELTAKQPIHYVKSNVAVCNGTDHMTGHPKVYINLDKDMVAHCGYCGAKYAREDLKGKL